MKDNRLLELLRKTTFLRKLIFSDRENEPDFGINKTQRGVLMYVAFNGPVAMNDVSEKFALEKGSFTQVADSLENLSYIERKRCEKDRRIIYLETTETGKDIAFKIHQSTEARINSLLSSLSDDERKNFMNSFETVCEYIDKIRGKRDC